jgi:hypothetical protein
VLRIKNCSTWNKIEEFMNTPENKIKIVFTQTIFKTDSSRIKKEDDLDKYEKLKKLHTFNVSVEVPRTLPIDLYKTVIESAVKVPIASRIRKMYESENLLESGNKNVTYKIEDIFSPSSDASKTAKLRSEWLNFEIAMIESGASEIQAETVWNLTHTVRVVDLITELITEPTEPEQVTE